jgi:hypothetical protein
MTRRLPALFVLPAMSVILALGSCAGGPRPGTGEGRGEFDALAPGGQVYFYADISRVRPVLELVSLKGVSGKQVAEILDRTVSAVGAFYPPGSPRRFLFESRGGYPVGRGKFSLAFSSAWKKTRSPAGKSYYYSPGYGFSLVLERNRALLSDQDPYAGAGGVTPPGRLAELREGAALAGWMENPGVPVNGFLAGLGIPLQVPADRLLFAVYEEETENVAVENRRYAASVLVETPSATQARALAALVSMARMVISGARPSDAGGLMAVAIALFANPPDLEEHELIIRTGPLDAGEIALLFSRFSVYSDQNNNLE